MTFSFRVLALTLSANASAVLWIAFLLRVLIKDRIFLRIHAKKTKKQQQQQKTQIKILHVALEGGEVLIYKATLLQSEQPVCWQRLDVTQCEFCWLCSPGGHQRKQESERIETSKPCTSSQPCKMRGEKKLPAGPWGKAQIRILSYHKSRNWIIHGRQLYSISYLIHSRMWVLKKKKNVLWSWEMLALGSGNKLTSWMQV